MTQYGYGRLPNVFTSLEFERLSQLAGPHQRRGRPSRRRDGAQVGRHIVHWRRQPRPQPQQLLLRDLLHAEPQSSRTW